MDRGRIIELTVEDMLDDGRAFGRCEGCAVFVSGGADGPAGRYAGAVPGDRIRAEVTKARKSSAEAVLVEIIEPSPDRIAAGCLYAGQCGGCSLQELSYDAQVQLKLKQVRAKLVRLGGISGPVISAAVGADEVKYYRNKAVFAVGPHGEVGFCKGRSHFVLDIEDCMLQNDASMVCAEALRTFLKRNNSGCITQMTVRTAFGTGEVMVVLESSRKDIPGIEELVEMLDDAIYSLSPAVDEYLGEVHKDASYVPVGVSYNDPMPAADSDDQLVPELLYSLESVAVIHKGKCRIVAGRPTIIEEVIRDDGTTVKFEISPQSFFQVNPEQMARIYDKAAEYADLKGGETVLDLYCGAGTIGIWMLTELRSRDEAAFDRTRVIGIESVRPAVLDANRNSVVNGLVNTRYICGKAEEELPGMMGLARLYKWNEVNERVEREPEISIERADVAVVDPPRAGCEEVLLDALVKAEPERIVYVSCDPGTLARDVKYLTGRGYEFIEGTVYDQFPWTSHVETVVLMSRGKD